MLAWIDVLGRGMSYRQYMRHSPKNKHPVDSLHNILLLRSLFLGVRKTGWTGWAIYDILDTKMSSRQLRKLQQQRELEHAKLQAEAEVEEASEEEPVQRPQKSKPSLFANLAALEDEDGDDDEADADKEEAEAEGVSEAEANSAPAPKAKKSKKKKKKAKSKAKDTPEDKPEDNDEIEQALRELNLKKPSYGTNGQATTPTLDPEYERVCALLGIQTQHLKVANEMRNLFGKTALENHDDAGGPVGRAARRQRAQQEQVDLETALKGHHPPGKGLPELILRRNCFIQGKDEWPKGTTGGLTMAVVDEKKDAHGAVEFTVVHDQTYQALQHSFHQYVEIGDPQNLIGLLIKNRKSSSLRSGRGLTDPAYHISLLTQVSKVARNQGDHALASDLLERALFTFGRATTTLFSKKLAEGKARFDFQRPENRELWLAGYQYIKSLVMKGTYRTALEWAKFLLSLDPTGDPYCMRLMIHQLALRAQEFEWLLDMCDPKSDSDEKSPFVVMSGSDAYRYHIAPSLAFAALQLRDGKRSRELLTKGMQQLPWLFARLFQDLNLDVPPSIWGITPRTRTEELFTALCIKYTKDLWDTPAATALLMEIAHTISKVDASSIPKVKDDELTLSVVRFVYLDDTPALMAMVPSALLHRSNNSDSDPIPPDNSIISYESQRIPLQQRDGFGDALLDFNDPLAAFQRLIPDLNNFAGVPRGVRVLGGMMDWTGERRGEEGEDDDVEGSEEPADDATGSEEEEEQRPSSTGNWLSNLLWNRRARAGQEEPEEQAEVEELEEVGNMEDNDNGD